MTSRRMLVISPLWMGSVEEVRLQDGRTHVHQARLVLILVEGPLARQLVVQRQLFLPLGDAALGLFVGHHSLRLHDLREEAHHGVRPR